MADANLHPTMQTALAPFMAAAPILAAEYTNGSKTRSPTLTINQIVNGNRHCVEIIEVSGKVQARRNAKARGATPWNF